MKIDDSNKRYSMIIVGILLITVLPVFVAFSMGVMGSRVFSDYCAQPIGGGLPEQSGKTDSENTLNNYQGNDKLVTGSKKGCDFPYDWDTEKGKIDVDIDQDPDYELPLCIKSTTDLTELNNALNITAYVCGGYCPQDDWSQLKLIQCGNVYWLGIDWTYVGHPTIPPYDCCCCWKEWEAEFYYISDICLTKSSQLPDTPSCLPICSHDKVWPDDIKEVELELKIKWEGCHFWTIPSSDFQFPESPTPELRFKKFIAS
jgi:hypothetical protein